MQMTRYLFSFVILLSIASGLLLPEVTTLWKVYQIPLLALLMFFSALRVESSILAGVDLRKMLWLMGFVFILMPLLALPFKLGEPLTFIGVLIALASPSAAATAFFSSFLGGDIACGVAISFFSSLLSIITLPLTISLFAGASMPIDNSKIFAILGEVIAVPIILALLSRKLFRNITEIINKHKDYQLIVMFLLSSSIIGFGRGITKGNEMQFAALTAEITAILLFGGVLAYLFGTRYGKRTAVTFLVATSVKNAMLSFEIVLELFGPDAVLPMVANLIAQFLIMLLFELFGSPHPQTSPRNC